MSLDRPPPLDPSTDALFLDFDGTLVGFADDPDAVEVSQDLLATLSVLSQRFDGALALVSGRALGSIDRLVMPLSLPAAGVHGQEFRHASVIESDEAVDRLLEPARAFIAAKISPDDPIRVEDKGGAIVLHFRTAPEQDDRARSLAERAAARGEGLVVVSGNAIHEVRPRSITKAGAILRFMERPPFAGRRPVFAGDDRTDEDGFGAVAAAGGYGVKVGGGETSAAYRLADIAAVHSWLRAAARN